MKRAVRAATTEPIILHPEPQDRIWYTIAEADPFVSGRISCVDKVHQQIITLTDLAYVEEGFPHRVIYGIDEHQPGSLEFDVELGGWVMRGRFALRFTA